MELQTIENGESMESIRGKINALINAYNLNFPVTKSYNDLQDKPAINGIELNSDFTMNEITIPVESLPNIQDIQQLFVDVAKEQAELTAREVFQEETTEILNLQNFTEAQSFVSDDWMILVYVPQKDNTMKLYKTTMKDVTNKAVWASNKFEAEIKKDENILEG